MPITRIQKTDYIQPKCDSVSFLPAGIQLIGQRLARKYDVDFICTDLIDYDSDVSELPNILEPFFNLVQQGLSKEGPHRAALLFNTEIHSSVVFYLKDNAHREGFLIADAVGSEDVCFDAHTEKLLKQLRKKFPQITCYFVNERRQKQAVGCRTDALVFIRDVMAKREGVYFKTPDLLNSLMSRRVLLPPAEHDREKVFNVRLPNILLKTAQSSLFFEQHYNAALGAANAAVHMRKDGTLESIAQFRARYQGPRMLSGRQHYFYLHRKAERFERIIVKEYYINEVLAELEAIFAGDEAKKSSILAEFQLAIYACPPDTDFFAFTKNYVKAVIKKEIAEKTLTLSKMLFVYLEDEAELNDMFEELTLTGADTATFLALFEGVLKTENSISQRFLVNKLYTQDISSQWRDTFLRVAVDTNQVSSAVLLLAWPGENRPSVLMMNDLLAWSLSGKHWEVLLDLIPRHEALTLEDVKLILQEGIKSREWAMVKLLIEKNKKRLGYCSVIENYLLDTTIPKFSRYCLPGSVAETDRRVLPQEAASVLAHLLLLAQMTTLPKVMRDFFAKHTKIDDVFRLMQLMQFTLHAECQSESQSGSLGMCYSVLTVIARYFPSENHFQDWLPSYFPAEKKAFLQKLQVCDTQAHSEYFKEVLKMVARVVSGCQQLDLPLLKVKLDDQNVRNQIAHYVSSAKPS